MDKTDTIAGTTLSQPVKITFSWLPVEAALVSGCDLFGRCGCSPHSDSWHLPMPGRAVQPNLAVLALRHVKKRYCNCARPLRAYLPVR